MRNVSRFCLRAHTLTPSGAAEMATVMSSLVLLCKMSCVFFSLPRLVCVPSQKVVRVLFLPFLPVRFCGGSLHFACLVTPI